MKTIRLLLTFYKSFAVFSIFITLSCSGIIFEWGISTITALIWFKIITLGIIFYTVSTSKNDSFSYYKNLGLSKVHLWIATFIFDFLLFMTVLILILKI